jgi:tRNA(adenine34) deaminase
MISDEKWMKIALNQAILAELDGEVPVGAVLVKNNILIAQAFNQPIAKNDVTAHAEIQVLRIAGQAESNYRLNNTSLYVTLEPCLMCLGAIMQARISRLIFGAYETNSDLCVSCENLNNSNFFNHNINITGGILENESKQLLKSFFKLRR